MQNITIILLVLVVMPAIQVLLRAYIARAGTVKAVPAPNPQVSGVEPLEIDAAYYQHPVRQHPTVDIITPNGTVIPADDILNRGEAS